MNQTVMMKVGAHSKEYFESMSQSLFFRNAFVGAAMLAIAVLFKPEVFLWGVFASFIGFGYSILRRTPKVLRWTGLLPVNGFFFGVSMATLFHQNTAFYMTLMIGALALPLLTKAAFEVLQHWKLTPLIAPYIFVVWVLYLCGDSVALQYDAKLFSVQTFSLPFSLPFDLASYLPAMLELPAQLGFLHAAGEILNSVLVSIGRIFFLQNAAFGACILLLVSLFSPRRGLFFALGTLLATIVFYQLTSGQTLLSDGNFSYSAGLVGLGLASLPEKFSWRTISIFCVFSLFLTLALSRLLIHASLPLLSLPYVLTFWLALLSQVPRLNVSWARVPAT